MGEHHEKHTIFGPFPDPDPLDTARLFLRTNRYQIVIEESGTAPDGMEIDPSIASVTSAEADRDDGDEDEAVAADGEDQAPEDKGAHENENENENDEDAHASSEVVLKLQASRGERWSGLTSSNMADLETTIDLALVANSIQVRYVVNTTGQLLNDDERAFWKREAEALEAFVTGGDLVSVVSDESSRATRARRDLLGQGMWFAAVVFVIVFILGIVYVRFV